MTKIRIILIMFLFISFSTHASSLEFKIQQLKSYLTHQRQKDADLHQQLQKTEMSLATLAQEIFQLELQQNTIQKEIETLQKKQEVEKFKLAKQHETLAHQVRTAYQQGKLNEVKILLNQEDPNKIGRQLYYYHYLTQKRMELIVGTKQTLASLSQTMQSISQRQLEIKNLLSKKQQQQKIQASAQKLRQQLIAQLTLQVQTKQQQLDVLIENQEALQDTINQIQKQPITLSSNYSSFTKAQGKLPWPVEGELINQFGSQIDNGGQHLAGVIIKAPIGTPIRAISSGKVVFANWLRGFGLLVILDHGNGYMSLYGRNQVLYTKLGNKINSGDLIASTGNTGGYQLPSLYFEIRQNGIPVNPSLWCRKT